MGRISHKIRFSFDACLDACVVDFVLKTTVNGVYDQWACVSVKVWSYAFSLWLIDSHLSHSGWVVAFERY